MFLKSKSDQVTHFLKSFYHLLNSFRLKIKVLKMAYNALKGLDLHSQYPHLFSGPIIYHVISLLLVPANMVIFLNMPSKLLPQDLCTRSSSALKTFAWYLYGSLLSGTILNATL